MADRNAPELILAGFDAGQTHTRCRLALADGRVIGQGEGSGVSHLGSSDGPERFAEALRSSLTAARQNAAATTALSAAAIGASAENCAGPLRARRSATSRPSPLLLTDLPLLARRASI